MRSVTLIRFILRRAGALTLALALLAAGPLRAQSEHWDKNDPIKRPYIFTQQNNVQGRDDVEGRVQQVRLGWPLQVQLPDNPAVWRFARQQSVLVSPRGQAMVYSPGRIPGTHSIFVFDFVLSPEARAGDEGMITLTTDALPPSLRNVMPEGVFAVTFTVIDPE